MSVKTIAVLKTYFETGDRPTEGQFADLIDSFIHKQSGAVIVSKSYDENTGEFSLGFSDNTVISFTIPLSAGIDFINGLQDALDNKVDKIAGKGLSSNDYTNTDKAQVATNKTHVENDVLHVSASDRTNWDNKVDQEAGKGLSSNDYTNIDKSQVATNKTHVENDALHVSADKDYIWSEKIKKWSVDEIFLFKIPFYRIYENSVYLLDLLASEYPFTTTDIGAEIASNKWVLVLEAGSSSGVIVNGNEFGLSKKPSNLQAGVIEAGDIILNGWWDASNFWSKAQYIIGDVNMITNWKKLDTFENI